METEKMLNELWQVRGYLESLKLRKRDALDALITSEIRSRMLAIEAEFEPGITETTDRIAQIEVSIREQVIRDGGSTKGTHLHAIFVKGRVTWDGKALDGYSRANPEILPFRKEGSPSVSIRAVPA